MAGEYTSEVYTAVGGASFVISTGGTLDIKTGGQILKNGSQQAAIADATTGQTTAQRTATINAILDALQGVGIVPTT